MYIECYLQQKHHKSYIKKNNFLQWSNEFQELKDNRAKNNTLMIWFWELDRYCLRYKSHISDSLQVSWKLICLLEKVMLQVQYTSSRNSFLFQMNGEHCNQNLLLFPSYWSLTDLFLFTQSGKLAKVESDKPKRAPQLISYSLLNSERKCKVKRQIAIRKSQPLLEKNGEPWPTKTKRNTSSWKQLLKRSMKLQWKSGERRSVERWKEILKANLNKKSPPTPTWYL